MGTSEAAARRSAADAVKAAAPPLPRSRSGGRLMDIEQLLAPNPDDDAASAALHADPAPAGRRRGPARRRLPHAGLPGGSPPARGHPAGLVRAAFTTVEEPDAVLEALAAAVSPRVLKAPPGSTPSRRSSTSTSRGAGTRSTSRSTCSSPGLPAGGSRAPRPGAVRPHRQLRRARGSRREPSRGPRGGHGVRPQPGAAGDPVPPRGALRRRAGRVPGRRRGEAAAARPRGGGVTRAAHGACRVRRRSAPGRGRAWKRRWT